MEREELKERVHRSIQSSLDKLKKTDNIVIFGCGFAGRIIRDELNRCNLEVNCIIDNDMNKRMQGCLGLPVRIPGEYFSELKGDALVFVCSIFYAEMIAQLKELGCPEKNIITIFDSAEEKRFKDYEEDFEKAVDVVKKGYEVYEKIISKYGNDHKLFICPYEGTGDVYMACGYLDEYIIENNIKDYVFAVVGGNCKRVANLFNVDNIETLTKDETELLLKAWEFYGADIMNIKPLLYWGWRTKMHLYTGIVPQATFHEYFLYDVFDFGGRKVSRRFPKQNSSNEFSENLFQKFQLRKGKTVIIAPYAGSFTSGMSINEWSQVVKLLHHKGYDVCTNCNGTTEKPLEGTIPIFAPYDELINLIEYAGGFVALRSGLCDIVSSAKCKMVIIYETGFNASSYSFFSLKNMGLNENEIALIYGEDNVLDTMDKCF